LDGWRGALDPSLFVTPDGQNILYAAFSDTEVPIHAIMLKPDGNAQIRRADGQADYWPYAIHGKRHGWEGRFIENPSMIYDPSTKTYLLAYSAGDWWSSSYSTGLARCTTPLGFCSSNSSGPWLASGRGRTGPGGLSFFTVGKSRLAVYASFAKGQEGTGQARHFTVAPVTLGWAPRLG
jgi:hypothetical protein